MISPTVPALNLPRVVAIDPQSDRRWESFVANHPGGSVYHHPAWLKVLEMEYGRKTLNLTFIVVATNTGRRSSRHHS